MFVPSGSAIFLRRRSARGTGSSIEKCMLSGTSNGHPICKYLPIRPNDIQFKRKQATLATAKLNPPFTAQSYPRLNRDVRYNQLTKRHVDQLKGFLESESACIDGFSQNAEDDLEQYNVDWMKKYRGNTKVVVKPSSTFEVSKIVRYCNENALPIVPQGGNTGLVGGSVPVYDEVIMSLSRMASIHSFDPVSGVLVADAGCILEKVDNFLDTKNHIFPLDLGAKGSCQIGGNLATNAGGLRLIRYGSLHGNVLGVEAVLPDGTIMDDLCQLRKNNTGYDLKQLLIGAEGTLGIITKVSIQCPQRLRSTNVAFFGLESYEKVIDTFRAAKKQLSEILSAFELMDAQSQDFVHQTTDRKRPLEGQYPFYCLIETIGSDSGHDEQKLESFLESVMGSDLVSDGVMAQDETQIQTLWSWREGIPESLGHWGGVYKYDVSIPLAQLYGLVDDTRDRLKSLKLAGDGEEYPVVGVVGYGHMGDSNLHLNVATRRYDKSVENALEPFVYEWIAKRNGSISAEHGLGLAKKPFLQYSRSETMIGLMRQIKDLYDPNGIMNPYKYI